MSRTLPADAFVVEPLGRQHDREGFTCGVPPLDAYLRRSARQDMDRGASVAYVLVPEAHPTAIAGFYTLSATAVPLDAVPTSTARKLPRYPNVPATLLGRLAVGLEYRGRHLGECLLVDALRRALTASRSIGSVAVVVDAKDDEGVRFYERYGFVPLVDAPRRLFIPMPTIAAAWAR